MTDPLTPGGQEWLGDLREILARTPDVLEHRHIVAAGWRALAAADRRRAAAALTPGEREWLRAVLDEALGVDPRAVTEPGAWATAAESLAWDVRYLRDRTEALGIAEWASPLWAQLSAAETLLDTARDNLASLPPTGGVDDVDDTDDMDASAAILAGLDAATGSSPDHPRVEELERMERVNPTDERAALVAALRPRIHDALDEAVAGLSLPELRALAAHPDRMAVLLLLAGLAARAEAADPEVSPDEAAALLADLRVTPAVVRRLVDEGVLPGRPRRSDVLGAPAGRLLAARRAAEADLAADGEEGEELDFRAGTKSPPRAPEPPSEQEQHPDL